MGIIWVVSLFKGGGVPNFFSLEAEGGPEFFTHSKEGDQEKLATGNHKQTSPLPVKNDNSLIFIQCPQCHVHTSHS